MSMSATRMAQRLLSDADLAFIAEAEQSALPDGPALRLALASDEALRAKVLGGDRLFRLVLNAADALVRISPRLFFEVLLRRAIEEVGRMAHVFERAGTDRVPVFLQEEAARAVADPAVVDYLADMLTSFTKVESLTLRVRVRRGVWRKERYSDLDVPSLLRLASETEEAHRMPVYKRAGDASLLILGVFPDFAATAARYPGSGALRPRRARLTTEEYENVAARAYRIASEHPAAAGQGVAAPMLTLSEHVIDARRPLNHLAEQYLRFRRHGIFGMGG